MYQRKNQHEHQLRLAPEPTTKPPRMTTMKAFGTDPYMTYSPCNLNCLQAFRHGRMGATNILVEGPEAHSKHVIRIWCGDHNHIAEGNEVLRDIFNAGHASGALYPGGTRHCYNQEFYYEKWYCVSELLPCVQCHCTFLSENDLREHVIVEHGMVER